MTEDALKPLRHALGPLLAVLAQFYPIIGAWAPFIGGALALYYVGRSIYNYAQPLRLKPEELEEERARLSLKLERVQRRLDFLSEKERRIRERLDGAPAQDRRILEAELLNNEIELSLKRKELNDLIIRSRFIGSLQAIIGHLEFLKRHKIWEDLEDLMKGDKPALIKRLESALEREDDRYRFLTGSLEALEKLIKDEEVPPISRPERSESEGKDVAVTIDDERLFRMGPEDWCVVFEEAQRRGRPIRINSRKFATSPELRNLLMAFLISPLGQKELSSLFKGGTESRFALRAIALLRGLRDRGEVAYKPMSSERADAEEVMKMMKEREEALPSPDPKLKLTRYEFNTPDGNRWSIVKEVRLDDAMRAKRITYRLLKE